MVSLRKGGFCTLSCKENLTEFPFLSRKISKLRQREKQLKWFKVLNKVFAVSGFELGDLDFKAFVTCHVKLSKIKTIIYCFFFLCARLSIFHLLCHSSHWNSDVFVDAQTEIQFKQLIT